MKRINKQIKIYSIINREAEVPECSGDLKKPKKIKKLENLQQCLTDRGLEFDDDLHYS